MVLAFNLKANNTVIVHFDDIQLAEDSDAIKNIAGESADISLHQVKFKRGKAILFTVFTGLFGGHRVYFGTKPRTPILYSITLGGLGILPTIDLINIIFTKDLSKFEDKPQVIMWGK